MKSLLRALLPRKSPKSPSRTARRACLELEPLESRLVPTQMRGTVENIGDKGRLAQRKGIEC